MRAKPHSLASPCRGPPEAAISDVLREEIRSGLSTQERKIAICTGAASLPPEERIEILTLLAADSDEIVREKAAGTLLTQPLANVMAALARTDAAPEMFAYCAAEFSRRPGVADSLAKNPTCPIEVLRPVVRYLSVTAVQDLFEDLDRLSTSPALVAALMEAAEIAEPDAAKRETLLQKISRLRVVERVQMAMKGTREARGVLIRDSCKVVQRAVLQSPQLTAREVESFAGMTSVSDETLRLIASHRKFRKNYTVTKALINNPKTPLQVSLHLLPTITPQDLKILTTNKNVPDTLRASANRLQRQRSANRDSG